MTRSWQSSVQRVANCIFCKKWCSSHYSLCQKSISINSELLIFLMKNTVENRSVKSLVLEFSYYTCLIYLFIIVNRFRFKISEWTSNFWLWQFTVFLEYEPHSLRCYLLGFCWISGYITRTGLLLTIFPQVWVDYASINARVLSWGQVLIKPFVDEVCSCSLFLEDSGNNTVPCEGNVGVLPLTADLGF